MKLLKKLLAITLIATLCLAVFTACGNDSQSSSTGDASNSGETEKTKITIGLSAFQDTLLPIIGEEMGWFEEAGLDVTFETLAWNSITPALASNSIDVAVYNTTGTIAVYEQMNDIVFLYPWNIFAEGQALMGRADGTKSVEDFENEGLDHEAAVKATIQQLKGKTIITTMGTDMGKAVEEACKNNGLTTDDYTIIDMDTDQGLAAFISGSGDFYLGGIPQRTRLESEGYVTMAVGSDLAPVPINGWVTRQGFVDENEDALLSLQNVMFRIIRYTRENTEEVGQIITDKLNQETGSEMTVDQFVQYFTQIEEFTDNASHTQETILDESGYAYWKKTWDNDNTYYVEVEGSIPEAVPYSTFQGDLFQQKYIAKYGADETGY